MVSNSIVGGVDLNCSFGHSDVDEICVGTVGCCKKSTDFSVDVMKDVVDCNMCLASSLSDSRHPCFVGMPYTYVTKDMSSIVTIDYTLYRGDVLPVSGSSCHVFELLSGRDNDHYPIGTRFSIAPSPSYNRPINRRVFEYDKMLIGKPDHDKVFLDCVSRFQGVPFSLEPSSHCHVLERVVHDALCVAYPKLKQRKRSEHISDITHGFIVQRNNMLKQYMKMYNSFF